jgi:hypothetical protein
MRQLRRLGQRDLQHVRDLLLGEHAEGLREMMIFGDCWSDGLGARYTPLRQIKKRSGRTKASRNP